MRMLLGAVVVAALASTVSMTPLAAGIFGSGGCSTCSPCNSCHVNPCACRAAPVMPVIQQPVVHTQTILQPQTVTVPQTTYRDVVRTEYRTAAELQQTPVTRYRTVAVDEGAWQQVWVSKVVQKTVPETVMEQRTVYKSVPYQVTERVPQTVYTTQTTMVPRVVHTPVAACNPCGSVGAGVPVLGYHTPVPTMISSSVGLPVSSYPTTIGAYPTNSYPTAAIGSYPAANPVASYGPEPTPVRSAFNQPTETSSGSATNSPVPDPKFLDGPSRTANDWTPVRTAEPVRTSSAAGRFVPAGRSATRIR
jgi:hypothetical protein